MLAVVRLRAAADRARRRRLHARGRARRRRAGAARLLRRGAGPRRRRGARGELVPVERLVRRRGSRCSTSGRRRSARTGWRRASATASARFGRIPLAELVRAGGAARARGRRAERPQAYVIEILAGIVTSTPECAALFAPDGRVAARGRRRSASPSWPTRSSGSGARAPAPFYEGDIAAAIVDWLAERGGLVTADGPGRLRGRRPRAGAGRATAGARCSPTRRRRPAGS